MQPFLNTAFTAVRQASRIMLRQMERLSEVKIQEKSEREYVTAVDLEVEGILVDALRQAYPHHRIVAEEAGEIANSEGPGEYTWVIDPLDGTNNFMRGLPHFCISMALMHKGQVAHGLIYNPVQDELFTASKGEGARLNGKRIRVSDRVHLDKAFLVGGSPHHEGKQVAHYLKTLESLYQEGVLAIRNSGSAALDLAYVAAGRYDGFWQKGLRLWDIAAGTLMVAEAGGLVSDLAGGHEFLQSGDVIVANPKLFKALMPKIVKCQAS